MRRAKFECIGIGPLVFGKQILESKKPDETNDQLDERTWKQRCTLDEKGNLAIPAFALKRSLVFAGKWLNEKIKGENKKTYTKRLECGVISESAFFPVSNGKATLRPEDVECLMLAVSSRGQKGGGQRVLKRFPRLAPGWRFSGSLLIIDDAITDAVFRRHFETAALYDGMGSMRIGTGNENGRYEIASLKFENATV